jgi:hypothetical protein
MTAETQSMIGPMIEKLALAQAFNDAWALMAVVTVAATLSLLVIIRFQEKELRSDKDQFSKQPLPAALHTQAPPTRLGL